MTPKTSSRFATVIIAAGFTTAIYMWKAPLPDNCDGDSARPSIVFSTAHSALRPVHQQETSQMSMIPAGLDEIMESRDYPNEWLRYIHPATGELVIRFEEEFMTFAEDGTLTEPHRKALNRFRKSLEVQGYIPLPGKFEVNEWGIMERFGLERTNACERELLLDAIHGESAFKRFKDVITHLNLRVEWAYYSRAALLDFARKWLEGQEIPYRNTT